MLEDEQYEPIKLLIKKNNLTFKTERIEKNPLLIYPVKNMSHWMITGISKNVSIFKFYFSQDISEFGEAPPKDHHVMMFLGADIVLASLQDEEYIEYFEIEQKEVDRLILIKNEILKIADDIKNDLGLDFLNTLTRRSDIENSLAMRF